MSRVKINFPEVFHFSTQLTVRISDINYGNHLGHDRMITMLHEARLLFFRSLGYQEWDVEGVGTIIADLAITYQNEAFYGDVLEFDISVQDISRKSCQLYYQVKLTSGDDQEKRDIVAQAKTAVVFFDFDLRKSVEIPPEFTERVVQAERR
jgi:YbgC/YbaW family acyl-CoA thioester hydrolase